jgi:hypothetical protein
MVNESENLIVPGLPSVQRQPMPGGGANRSGGRGMLTEQPQRFSGRPRLCCIGNGSAGPVIFSPSHRGHWPWSVRSGMTAARSRGRLVRHGAAWLAPMLQLAAGAVMLVRRT